MDPLATVRRRLAEQRLAGEPFGAVGEAVAWFGAVQAQEFAEAKWSLGERIAGCTDAAVEAAFARGDIIRTHVLRPTWHFIARDDVRWLLRLSRQRVHALNRYHYREWELDGGVLAKAHAVLARSLAGGEALTRTEVVQCLAAGGIAASGVRLALLLMHVELEEVICSGPRRGKQQTYALLDDRVPTGSDDDMPRERALDELVLRYFRSHGPATIKDFSAWSSLTGADTKAALARVGDDLVCVEDEAGKAWYAAAVPHPSSARAAGAYLIPTYDETLVAYQDLRVVLPHESPAATSLMRCIVIDGRTHGSWKRSLTARSVVVEALLPGVLGAGEAIALDEVVSRFGRFLGLPASSEVRRV